MIEEVFTPKEGDIVKIITPNKCYDRDYMLVIWPKESDITPHNLYVSCKVTFIVDLNGEYHDYYKTFGFNPDEDILTKPSMYDMIELSRMLRENGLRYNRKKKQIIKVEDYESNR